MVKKITNKKTQNKTNPTPKASQLQCSTPVARPGLRAERLQHWAPSAGSGIARTGAAASHGFGL